MFLLALYHSARLHLLRAITNISHSATIITMFWKSSRIVFFFRLQVCRPAGQIPLLLWDIIRLTENVEDITSTLFTEQTISVSICVITCLTYNSCSA